MNIVQATANRNLTETTLASQSNWGGAGGGKSDSFQAVYDRVKTDTSRPISLRETEDVKDVGSTDLKESWQGDDAGVSGVEGNGGADRGDVAVDAGEEKGETDGDLEGLEGVEDGLLEEEEEGEGLAEIGGGQVVLSESVEVSHVVGGEMDRGEKGQDKEGKAGALGMVKDQGQGKKQGGLEKAMLAESGLVEANPLSVLAVEEAGSGELGDGGEGGEELLLDGKKGSGVKGVAGDVATDLSGQNVQGVGSEKVESVGKVALPEGMVGVNGEATTSAAEMKAEAGRDELNAARITRGIENAVKQRGGSLTIRMSPPDMGIVKLELEMKGGAVTARLQAEHDSVRQMLTQKITQLHSALEGQGLQVDKLTVQTMDNSSASSFNEHQEEAMADGRSKGQAGRGGSGRGGRGESGGRAFEEFEEAFVETLK